ncbi:SspB family protein [Ancylobacter sp. FA202]|uniref:SspB family protein n=1 Tax=Ancylobacter sp. FA202 TaxID=1111106 RepID=UPI00036AAF71|nr:ClpXP protease specificity-enhancing factor SspB [Ancylobacter sp. FA202]
MSVDLIRYDLLVQDALRGVVGRVLTDVARDGLPGEHHLYLAFDTCAPGVRISPRLKERYPEEMTIVLQHQFWDLIVTDQFFEVGLSFNGIPERLHVPYAALKGFFDPSVKFGLQFESVEDEDDADAEDDGSEAPTAVPTPIGESRPTSVPSTRAPTRLAEVPPKPAPTEAVASRSIGSKPAAPKPAAPVAVPDAKAAPKQPGAARAPAVDAASSEDASRPSAGDEAPGKTAPDSKVADSKASDAKSAEKSVDGDEPTDGGSGGAQVVRLDAFRKK